MPPGSRQNYWDKLTTTSVAVDCFLPTGVVIQLDEVRIEAPLSEIKNRLWREASNYPLFNLLTDAGKNASNYSFLCVNQRGKQEELVDESRPLNEVKPFRPLLKLIHRKGDNEEKLLNSTIGNLIGKSLHEFDQMQNQEVDDFRRKYRKFVEKLASNRRQLSWIGRAMYAYPPEIETTPLPLHIEENLSDDRRFLVNVAIKNNRASIKDMHAFSLPADAYPDEVIVLVLDKRGKIMGVPDLDKPVDYVLKIVGRESYLLGNYPLLQYTYIRTCIAKGIRPMLSLVLRASLQVEVDVTGFCTSTQRAAPPPLPQKPLSANLSLWNIQTHVRIKVVSAANVNAGDLMKVCVRAGIYHGSEALCDIVTTKPEGGSNPMWNEYLDFDLDVCNIPRMARLCLVIYSIYVDRRRTRNKRSESIPVAWVNTTLFDYQGKLRQGELQLFAWPVPETMADQLNPVGTVVSNIDTVTSVSLYLEFQRYSNAVVYPSFDTVAELAAQHINANIFGNAEQSQLDKLKQIVNREPLAPIFEQEKDLVWERRIDVREHFPHALAKLLCCVKWNSRQDVAMMQILLQTWPKLESEQALELLDYTFADQAVRRIAVECIEKMSDREISQYLLQLVQVLKYESYLDCELAEFLLRRALNNQHFGHALYWLLRAEMENPEVSVRFGLMLEAYCRGAPAHMKSLQRQAQALSKMKSVTELLQLIDRDRRERGLATMKELLRQKTYQGALSKLSSPLDPSFKLRNLNVDQCKYMDSKMRPLYLVFENTDELGDLVRIIFKNGDDLRQDMLTLQLIRIMDRIWQNEGLDLGMIPYGCLSTGSNVGMIEVVYQAETLAKLQRRRGGVTAAFSRDSIWVWLQEYHATEESLTDAVERFTLSCVGYCVATYVLGVGDRHSDNIMVKNTGQLFHIDFGHILGNFKRKFGVQRERVPFVLSDQFVHVITMASEKGRDTPPFERFNHLCREAFLIIRRKGALLINLFVMMLSAGLPELRSLDDIGYLRKTLRLDLSEDEAVRDFQKKFDAAINNSWKTSMNWFAHNVKRDNP
ncbi:phosphatidylinositol 4,5-bisphosphate 3-kinase catalytic subunit beta isoform-like [Acropora millepora]|uniref:phosphatidylinositol 4,5-bisphosphate 3-kinase catalytic subunit beta isoform-like n=1 Tax=Acropora millepora TaxID=45264 RepID=UPI001CF57507|nr:phosphatidylinositol 4,5-bisphosphate 3-kinase catalytic subunit beta isoform-like [Acropora millepora]